SEVILPNTLPQFEVEARAMLEIPLKMFTPEIELGVLQSRNWVALTLSRTSPAMRPPPEPPMVPEATVPRTLACIAAAASFMEMSRSETPETVAPPEM